MTGWHLDDDTLRCYVERTDLLAEGASVEQHLLCASRFAVLIYHYEPHHRTAIASTQRYMGSTRQ